MILHYQLCSIKPMPSANELRPIRFEFRHRIDSHHDLFYIPRRSHHVFGPNEGVDNLQATLESPASQRRVQDVFTADGKFDHTETGKSVDVELTNLTETCFSITGQIVEHGRRPFAE